MSPPDKNGENESKREKENTSNETEGIIFPIAPQPSFENSEQIGISSTPAFQCVDDVSFYPSFHFSYNKKKQISH